MPATDLLEDDSESILDDSDYKMLKREETRATPRKKVLAPSRHIRNLPYKKIPHTSWRRQSRRSSTVSLIVDLVRDAFVNIQEEQSSFAD
eukprot:scaffold13283_cov29-Attheya_sp.AAC.1